MSAPTKISGKGRNTLPNKAALGRSCGGFSTKVHGVCDALGNPIGFIITAGQTSDHTQGKPLIEELEFGSLLADKGYASNSLREFVQSAGSSPEIPPRSNRIIQPGYDQHL